MVYEPHHLNTMWKRGEDGKMAPADSEGPDAIPLLVERGKSQVVTFS